MSGGYVVYEGIRWQLIGETYHFADKDQLNSDAHSSHASFIQVAYLTGATTAYVRYETTSLNQDDHYFADQDSGISYQRSLVGIRHDLNHNTALKLEGSYTKDKLDAGDNTWNGVRAQVAVSF